ncbi:cathepsin L-like [Rhipicephalus sanguineus]|uniref:cathepsin L-like n=1 Tax=Rhipicephalus sanguineus TaxID=34632 RepID=UPI0020C34215|nr:cathepsin L-like [Rhipicephalus sanguineus]
MLNASVLPDSVDWRNKGAVTPVKTQGPCLATWAFSATGAVESQHFIRTGQLVDLSEQNLIDCSQDFGNLGCEGGRADQAFEYIIQNKGVDLEELYPYAFKTMPCAFDKGAVGATLSGFHIVPQMSEEQLQIAVATVGPVAVVIDAAHDDFFQYHQEPSFFSSRFLGIYNNPFCSASDVNYGLLVVGYGTANGIDYWICKNSMGPDWGEHGYIRMARNKQNQCGIATSATYPEI